MKDHVKRTDNADPLGHVSASDSEVMPCSAAGNLDVASPGSSPGSDRRQEADSKLQQGGQPSRWDGKAKINEGDEGRVSLSVQPMSIGGDDDRCKLYSPGKMDPCALRGKQRTRAAGCYPRRDVPSWGGVEVRCAGQKSG